MKKEKEDSDRRRFLKFGVLAGGATLAGLVVQKNLMGDTPSESGEKVKVLTADGKLVEVDKPMKVGMNLG